MGDLRIGISGWRYKGWRGSFYPKDLIQKKELEFASSQINSIEINGSFYSLQRPSSFESWYKQTPKGFVFSVKGNRYITHIKMLNDVETPLANFYASGVLGLKEKLGPFLWQFPPRMKFDPARLETFIKLLPRTSKEAVLLSKKCDIKWKKNKFKYLKNQKLRHCIEVRNESFLDPKFFSLLVKYDIAFVIADTAGKWPYKETVTSDFVYFRLHGPEELYVSGYDLPALKRWKKLIDRWKKDHDIFVYFDNDAKVKAPFDAMTLSKMLNRKSK
jgi:uncharacterized protein YecE (DUF72 family)